MHAETCGSQLALEHIDLYSCDHYFEPAYLLGNIKDMLELIALPREQQFGYDKRDMGRMRCAAWPGSSGGQPGHSGKRRIRCLPITLQSIGCPRCLDAGCSGE